jgi:hypothetical protein
MKIGLETIQPPYLTKSEVDEPPELIDFFITIICNLHNNSYFMKIIAT